MGLMLKFKQFINEKVSAGVLKDLEKYFDKIYKPLGIDIDFQGHFRDRLHDPRNIKDVSRSELNRVFVISKKKHGGYIKKMSKGAEAVISDMETDVNMPFMLKKVKGEKGIDLQLIPKTILRKPNFKTSNKKLKIGDPQKKNVRKKGWSASHRDHPKWIQKYGRTGGHKLGTKYSSSQLAAMRKRLGR